MPTVAVDAMSGHLGPDEIVKAVAQASLETDIQMLVVGDERQIQPILESIPYNPEHISLHHAPQAIGMDEDPRMAVRHKRKASLPVAARLVAEGQAEALVTAGHTGAAVLACTQHLRLIRGIRKAALASVYPRQTEHAGQDQLALLLDVGATIRCDTPELVQFAVMGNAYARAISKVANPRIALLNMGTDETRGGEVLVHAYRQLEKQPGLHFIGNIQGNDLTKGTADVIVCEGLLGHVALKLLEGLAEVVVNLAGTAAREHWRWKLGLMMLASGFGKLADLTDYAAYAGAPILGFENPVITVHARANARALRNAVKVAAKAVRDGVTQDITAAIRKL